MHQHSSDINVSIIMPVFNGGLYLQQTIDSVLAQTFEDFELIAIDDGSTDDSISILRAAAMNDARIRVYSQKNSGVSATRNRGIQLSTGEYIGFLDADDILHPRFIETLYTAASRNQAQIVVTGYDVFYHTIPANITTHIDDNLEFIPEQKSKWFRLLQDHGLGISTWNKLFSKALLESFQITFPLELSYGEDMFFCWRAVLAANSIVHENSALYYYRLNETSATMKYHENLEEKYYSGFASLLAFSQKYDFYNDDLQQDIDTFIFQRLPAIVTMIVRSKKSIATKCTMIQNTLHTPEMERGYALHCQNETVHSHWYAALYQMHPVMAVLRVYAYNIKVKLARMMKSRLALK